MTTAGLGLMKLPPLGSNNHILVSTDASDASTLTDRRRASITDPSLHAHSSLSQPNPPGHSQSQSQSAHEQLSGRSYTLPSFRDLSRHSLNNLNILSRTEASANTLQPPSHPRNHGSAEPAAAPRRGSAADLEHILLSSNTCLERHTHHQPAPDHSISPTANLSMADQQIGHSHPPQPYNLNSFSFDSPVQSVHQHHQTHPANTPVSPRSFSSASLTAQSELNIFAGPNRRPPPMRRRGSRVKEMDAAQSEDPSRAMMSGPGGAPNGSDYTRGLQTAAGSHWPYPAPHHRHHLQKPVGPVKRRGSSQSIPESTAPLSTCFGIPPDQPYGPSDQPWNTFRLMTNPSYREAGGDGPTMLKSYRLDARRESEASSVSSTGLSYDRRQSGESGECEGPDDIHHTLPPIPSSRRRSWSSSSKQSVPPFSPSQTAVMSDHAFPSLPFKDQSGPSPTYAHPASGDQKILADNGGWCNPLDDVLQCGAGVEDVYDLKDRLAATRLLDRLPFQSQPAQEGVLGQASQYDRPSNPYSRSPELKISHKLAERKRRKEMRDLFDELRDVLPPADERHSKGSKWETLSRAIDYVQQLKVENENLRRENVELKNKVGPLNHESINAREDQNIHKYPPENTHDGFG